MKKEYKDVEMEVIEIETEDVICESLTPVPIGG